MEEEERFEKRKWFTWSPSDTTKGAVIGAAATIAASVGLWFVKEVRDAVVARNSLRAMLHHVHTMTLEARDAHLNHAEPQRVRQLLKAAETTAQQIEKVVEAQPIVCNAMLALWGYDAIVLRHLRAHIEYHLAKVELRSGDADSISKASARLGAAHNLRAGLDNAEPERIRLRIKLGDVASQQRAVSHAKRLYEEHVSDPSKTEKIDGTNEPSAEFPAKPEDLPSFWEVRACNNLAVLHFGLAEDEDANKRMRQVVELTGRWMEHMKFDCSLTSYEGRLHADDQLVNAALALKEGRGDVGWPSAKLNRLLRAAEVDAVDTLHLPYKHFRCLPPDMQAHRHVHIERLERITLMLRKYCTSRANALLLACTPYQSALPDIPGPASSDAALPAALPASRVANLLMLLTDAVSTPPAAEFYFALDAPWIAEGASRMFAAVGWGLVELLASGAIADAELKRKVRAHAEELLTAALQPFSRVAPRLSSTHLCIATLAASRFEEICTGGPQAALDRLSAPAVREPLGASVLQWSMQAQLRARAAVHAQVAAGVLHPTSNVPPRNARWQLSVLVRAIGLKEQLGLEGEITDDEWDALEFAGKSCTLELSAAVSEASAAGTPSANPLAKMKLLLGLEDTITDAEWDAFASAGASCEPVPPAAAARAAPLTAALQRLRNVRTTSQARRAKAHHKRWQDSLMASTAATARNFVAAGAPAAAATAPTAASDATTPSGPDVTAAAAPLEAASSVDDVASTATVTAAGKGSSALTDDEVKMLLRELDTWKGGWKSAASKCSGAPWSHSNLEPPPDTALQFALRYLMNV